MKICPNCRHTEVYNLKYCPACIDSTIGHAMVDAVKCVYCGGWREAGRQCICRKAPSNPNPNVYVEYEAWPTDDSVTYALGGNNAEELETRLYDLTRKQNRTTWENEELARLRAEWKAKKGYDYV